jgi:hypothetical protein
MGDPTPAARPKIGDIIRDAGAVGGEGSGPSISDLAGVGVLFGESVATLTASMTVGQALADHFGWHADSQMERVLVAPYPIAARALVLALHARGHQLVSAIDTSIGAAIEAKAGMSLLHNAAAITLIVSETDPATTHVVGHSDIQGQIRDFGQNKGILNGIYDKADDYIKLLSL